MSATPLNAIPLKKLIVKKNGDVILNRAKYYYKNDKERLREQARDKYRNLSEEEKNKKREYGKNRYHNMSEEKKQRLKEYQQNYQEAKKLKQNILTFFLFIVQKSSKKFHISEKKASLKSLFIKTKNLLILTK